VSFAFDSSASPAVFLDSNWLLFFGVRAAFLTGALIRPRLIRVCASLLAAMGLDSLLVAPTGAELP
jgi:hypothetical protein